MPATARQIAIDSQAEMVRRIAAFMRGFSLEATKLDIADLHALKAALPAGVAIYLTAIRGRPAAELTEAAVRLRALGFEPVPHLAVRNLPSRDALDDLLAEWAARASVRRVLVIAGDRDQPAGPFNSAVDVIESGLLSRYGIQEVGIAGYPQGHPRISPEALDRALAAKVEAADQTGLRVHIITQFGFDAGAMLNWLARLRELGIEHPVRMGLAGPSNIATLLRYAKRCGVRASVLGLTRQAGLIKHLIGTSAPDGLIRPLAEAATEGRLGQTYGQVTPHFFSFGGAAATARWAAAVAAGRIVLDRADGFGVEPP